MMDFESTGNSDLIYDKISKTIDKSNNILHKKAITLIKGLKEQLGSKSSGVEGIKNYIKNVLDLIDIIFNKISNPKNDSLDEDIKNAEALLFTLAICLKRLPHNLLRNVTIYERIIFTVEKFIRLSHLIKFKNEIKKYSIIIAEKLLMSRNENELKDENDTVMKFYCDLFFLILEESSVKSEEDIQKNLLKSLTKIFKIPNMTNILKLTFLQDIKLFLIRKIRGLNLSKDYEGNTMKLVGDVKTKQINTNEGEAILKFLCSILQFLPFEIVNDLILELTEMIVTSENKHILLYSLLCFEVAFNTKTFALETNEKIISLLLSKDFLINANDTTNFDNPTKINNEKIDINTSLIIAFMKSTTSVLMNLGRLNIFLGMKHFTSVLSILGEFLTSNDEFLKNSMFNCIQNLFNSLMSKKNMNIIFTSIVKKNNPNEINVDPNELTLDVSLSNKKEESQNNVITIFENISHNLMYLISDRFEDLKLGFNLLHNFIEKLTTFNLHMSADDKIVFNNNFNPIIENILSKLSENEKLHKTQTFKIFLGKIFNFVQSGLILRLFQLQILDFDICSDEYTENSKVWIISYIDKFLRSDNVQSLKEFYESFMMIIEDLEIVLKKLKNNKNNKKQIEGMIIEEENNEMEIEDDMDEDENFAINNNESLYVRSVKIKRYELILQQIWSLLTKFTQWNENYELYVKEILKKLEMILNTYNKDINSEIYIPNIREIIFKVLSKFINNSFKFNDMKSLEVIKKEGKVFFSKCLSLIVTQKLTNAELKDGFNLVASFCRIMSDKFLYKIVCDMIEKIDKSFNASLLINDNTSSNSNKAKLNESLNISLNEEMNVEAKTKTKKDKKQIANKEINLLCLRIEIINYIVKNVNSFKAIENETQTNIFSLLNSFFEKFFFNDKLNQNIRKKLIDLFIILLGKIEKTENIIEFFSKFANEYKGLDYLSAKQKTKIFEFIVDVIVNKFKMTENNKIEISECFSQLHILIEIVSLTKDMNRKVRNSSYEMIGKITDFMTESNLFNEWIKMILAILVSNSCFLKSASINALARIFWQKRNSSDESYMSKLLLETSSVILLLFKENNKELTRSIFLFIRVLLYLNKNFFQGSQQLTKKILDSIFIDSKEDIRKEFKVKIRNLLKNLINKFSYEEIKVLLPQSQENLLAYINKYVVKKSKSKEDESVYGGVALDHSVMLDNDENLLDEEEEYIEKEFKKLEKRKDDMEKMFERLDKFNIEEDDPELIKKKNEEDDKKNHGIDKIEQLFKKDNIELENFFYVNPYAINQIKKDKQDFNLEEKDNDVYFDRKKGKIMVKDIPITTKDNKVKDKQTPLTNSTNPENDFKLPANNFLNKKRVQTQNVRRDNDFDQVDDDLVSKMKKSMNKTNQQKDKKRSRETHVVKFSGEEYKNKAGKGDKLIQGKYEPFAYIQLNPKSTSNKSRRETLDLFKGVMHPEKQHK